MLYRFVFERFHAAFILSCGSFGSVKLIRKPSLTDYDCLVLFIYALVRLRVMKY